MPTKHMFGSDKLLSLFNRSIRFEQICILLTFLCAQVLFIKLQQMEMDNCFCSLPSPRGNLYLKLIAEFLRDDFQIRLMRPKHHWDIPQIA